MTLRLLPIAAMTAAAFAAMSAHAASVDVYGVLDTGLHYTHSDSGDTSVTMDSGISKGSRVGIIGSEDLGNGCKIVFNLETGFNLDDGTFDNTKDRLFNRNAYVGIDSPYGEVRFGRQGALRLRRQRLDLPQQLHGFRQPLQGSTGSADHQPSGHASRQHDPL